MILICLFSTLLVAVVASFDSPCLSSASAYVISSYKRMGEKTCVFLLWNVALAVAASLERQAVENIDPALLL